MVRVESVNYKQRYEKWKHKNADVKGLSKTNSDLFKQYLFDMENEINISTKKEVEVQSD